MKFSCFVFFRRNLILLLFFSYSLGSSAMNQAIEPVFDSPGYSSKEFASPPEFFQNEKSGSTYTPFQSGQAPGGYQTPVLYGPGGDPIGGLPVMDNLGLITLLSAIYFGILKFKEQKTKR